MRRWLQFGLIDSLVAIILLPPGAVLTFQATLLLLRATHESKIKTTMTTAVGPIVECRRFEPMTDRERLGFLKRLVVDTEAALAAGELDVVEYPDIERRLNRWRGDIDRLELRLAAEDFLRQPARDEFLFAAEGMR